MAATWLMQYNSALVMGATYGLLHVVGPDHLGTLIALSVANPPKAAFSVGVSWATGHSVGMILVAAVILLLQRMFRINVEAWEHVGDYIIGLSMVLCGLYFCVRESELLEERDDGTFAIKECCSSSGSKSSASCGEDPATACFTKRQCGSGKPSSCSSSKPSCCSKSFCGSYGTMAEKHGDVEESPFLVAPESDEPSHHHHHAEVHAEAQMPSCCGGHSVIALSNHDVEGALLGVVQGLCCPMGLLGVAFLAKLRPTQATVFMIIFLFVSALVTGALAFTWSWLVHNWLVHNRVVTHAVPTKVLYRGSCFFTIGLGIVWITANYFNILSNINYAEHHHMGNMGDDAPALIRLVQQLNLTDSAAWQQ